MNNVSKIEYDSCTGCGLCKSVCHFEAIKMSISEDTFVHPEIKKDKCVNCGVCLNKCPLNSRYDNKFFSAYSFSVTDVETLSSCSSGGFAWALASYYINQGGIVYGVSYSDDFSDIKYNRFSEKNELKKIKGSKYSETEMCDYNIIVSDLKENKKVLFIGLPCQVAAVKNYTKGYEDQIMLVSLICLGKSSKRLYSKFICSLQDKYSANIVEINMRYKKKNWLNSWIKVEFDDGRKYLQPISSDPYGVLSHEILRNSCYSCKFKLDNAPSDILIGDFWGSEYLTKDAYNPMGTSAVICFNKDADKLVKNIEGKLTSVDIRSVLKTNGAIEKSAHKPHFYDYAMKEIKEDVDLNDICNKIFGKRKMFCNKMKYRIKTYVPVMFVNIIKRVKKVCG